MAIFDARRHVATHALWTMVEAAMLCARRALWATTGLLIMLLAGCASGTMRLAAPEASYERAEIAGFRDIRYFGDSAPLPNIFEAAAGADAIPQGASLDALLLSGGGADGAFGAGLLNGWSQSGARPVFQLVTGVSIGALIAPFAFLGSEYDPQLREMFLARQGPEDIFTLRIFRLITGDGASLASSRPLQELIASYVDEDMINAVAAEHRRGRRLLVGTTNLDARRAVIWDMGAIAVSEAPMTARLELFRTVLLASASIPGVAPPVFIDVEIDGGRYQEMHVDGGVINSVFITAPTLSAAASTDLSSRITRTIYVIQNNTLRAQYGPTDESIFAILGDTVSELIRAQSRGDQERIFTAARLRGVRYRLASVPEDFVVADVEPFDPAYLRALFAVGERLGRSDDPWVDAPPETGLDLHEILPPEPAPAPAPAGAG